MTDRTVTAISPVLPVALLIAKDHRVSFLVACDILEPFTTTGDDGVQRFCAEIFLPAWLLDTIQRATATVHPGWLR